MENKKKLVADPLNGSIIKNMIIFALPLMGISLLYTLFGSIDTMVVGRFGHENAMSAIGVSQSVTWTIIGVVMSLSAGVSMVFGRMYGEGKKKEINELLQALPLSIFFLSVCLAAIAIILAPWILTAVNCPDNVMSDALIYFRLYFCMVPFMVTFSFMTSVVQSKGDSVTPMVFQIIAQVANLLMNLLFVIVFDWNLFGVALATVLCEVLAMTMMTVHLTRQKDELHLDLKHLKFFTGTKEIWEKGIPSSLEGFALNITATVLASFINGFSATIIAGNTVAGSIEGLMMMGFSGFEAASVVFIAQNLGAKDMKRVKKVFVTTVAFVSIICFSIGALCLLFAEPLTSLFTKDAAIQAAAIHRMQLICLFYFLCGNMNSIMGCIRGLQDAKTPLVISIIASVCFRLGYLMTVAKSLGTVESVYMAFPYTWGLATFLGIIAFIVIYRKRVKQIEAGIEIK